MIRNTSLHLQMLGRDCILRHAAGYDWLVHVRQDGESTEETRKESEKFLNRLCAAPDGKDITEVKA